MQYWVALQSVCCWHSGVGVDAVGGGIVGTPAAGDVVGGVAGDRVGCPVAGSRVDDGGVVGGGVVGWLVGWTQSARLHEMGQRQVIAVPWSAWPQFPAPARSLQLSGAPTLAKPVLVASVHLWVQVPPLPPVLPPPPHRVLQLDNPGSASSYRPPWLMQPVQATQSCWSSQYRVELHWVWLEQPLEVVGGGGGGGVALQPATSTGATYPEGAVHTAGLLVHEPPETPVPQLQLETHSPAFGPSLIR